MGYFATRFPAGTFPRPDYVQSGSFLNDFKNCITAREFTTNPGLNWLRKKAKSQPCISCEVGFGLSPWAVLDLKCSYFMRA